MRYTAESNPLADREWIIWENNGEDRLFFAVFRDYDYEDGDAERHAKKVAGMMNGETDKQPEQRTLRDEFAGRAMQGMIAAGSNAAPDKFDALSKGLAEYSYKFADAMLTERQKGG